MNTKTLHRLLAGFAVVTVLVLVWHRYGMESVLAVDAGSPYVVRTIDDRSSGGNSHATFKRENGTLVMDCHIQTGYEWPYCELAIELAKAPQGVDLSRYDTVKLWIRYDGPEPRQQVRFFVLNFNPAYSKLTEAESSKVEEIFYDPSANHPLEVKLSQFTVASWWSNEHAIPIEHAGIEFENVTAVQVATGGQVMTGPHRIVVERIEFRGKLISAASLRLLIIAVWLLAAFTYLIDYAANTRRQLLASRSTQLSLQRINEALRIETQNYQWLARRDPLTGILNRQGLGDELVRATQRGDDKLFPLSLVFMDIDHFKRINDEHGHAVGDQVIRDIAQMVKGDIQRRDPFARWGGEEFLLICPLTAPHEARRLAERLRQRIAARQWPQGMRVTSSFGVAESVAGEDLVDSIKRADEAMYRAKQNGRDRVELQLAALDDGECAA
jgi:diguanylate cyclase (GGDEF)-like protein